MQQLKHNRQSCKHQLNIPLMLLSHFAVSSHVLYHHQKRAICMGTG